MDDIKCLTPHASRVNGTVSLATIPWRFTYLCWNIPRVRQVVPHGVYWSDVYSESARARRRIY